MALLCVRPGVRTRAVRVAGLTLSLILASRKGEGQLTRMPDGRGGFVLRSCEPTVGPKTLPTLDALVDSQAVMRHLRGARDSIPVAVSLSFAENGSVRGARVLEPPGSKHAAAVAQFLKRRARRQQPGQLWAVRVYLTGTTVRIERSVFCPPQRDTTRGRRRGQEMIVRRRMVAHVSISAKGDVEEVKLVSKSGALELDEGIRMELYGERYFPALLDGEAIPSWLRTDGSRMRL